MTEEKYILTQGAKKKIGLVALIGVVLTALGLVLAVFGGHGDHHAAEAAGQAADAAAHHGPGIWHRIWAGLWINNVYFTGIAVIGLFFVAFNYAAQAGWSAPILRIPFALTSWIPIGGVLMLIVFFLGGHEVFHWTHEYLYDVNDPRYDAIIAGKAGYLNTWFFVGRMVLYIAGWYLFSRKMLSLSLQEDLHGGFSYWHKLRTWSALFLIFFAVTSSTSAWDWILSIDTHWFSTLFGWYNMASWLVSGVALITLITISLKTAGYLKVVNANHIHDLGKFVFGFSIFWAYLWVSQYLLYYYANIPEETVYYWERWNNYYGLWIFNVIINFFMPFLLLMTRDSKRYHIILQTACVLILVGHWLDFYLGVHPGVMKDQGSIGFYEIGVTLIYAAVFMFITLTALAKNALVPKNHPMLEEAKHHHI
jgi:hypothetical protein